MEKKKISAISIVLYIIGVLFLAVSAFMLVLAVSYTRTYIESYDASFADMWSNSIQYIIKEFAPYLGIGIICMGIGYAVGETRKVRGETAAAAEGAKAAAEAKAAADSAAGSAADAAEAIKAFAERNENRPEETAAGDCTSEIEKLKDDVRYLKNHIDTTREVLSIKIEEKEKRDVFRILDLSDEVKSVVTKTAAAEAEIIKKTIIENQEKPKKEKEHKKEKKESEKTKTGSKTIPLFRVAQTMAMPAIPGQSAPEKKKKPKTAKKKKSSAAKKDEK